MLCCMCWELISCTDPGSFVRGGPTLTFFLVDEGMEDMRAIIDFCLQYRHFKYGGRIVSSFSYVRYTRFNFTHLNSVSLAGR